MADDQLYTLMQKMKDLSDEPQTEDVVADAQPEAPVPAPEAPTVEVAKIDNRIENISATGEGLFQNYEQIAQSTTVEDLGSLAGIQKDQ